MPEARAGGAEAVRSSRRVYLAEALVESSAKMPPGVADPINLKFVQDCGIPGGPDEWRRISQLVCEV